MRDVTARYAYKWCSLVHKARVDEEWWAETMRPYSSHIAEQEKEERDITSKYYYMKGGVYLVFGLCRSVVVISHACVGSRVQEPSSVSEIARSPLLHSHFAHSDMLLRSIFSSLKVLLSPA